MRNWQFNHIDFSIYPFYGGNDLGVFASSKKTTFKIWAPSALSAELRLYKNGKGGAPIFKENLIRGEKGTWQLEVEGDLLGKFYTFRVNDGQWLNEIPDIYARCIGPNGKRGMIFDPAKTNPKGWENDKGPRYASFADAVIYETHIRDFSVSKNSGIKNKGKFLGFTEKNTHSPEGLATGLSHLAELGITHVHLLPVADFYNVDEENPARIYNWGYDPHHFNAPEGSFSKKPADGRERIKELKLLVKALHDNGIGVIFDVVYNHTGRTKSSVFNQTVPGYFYRQNPDGSFSNASGCGNEIASERSMARKYILDSLKYWAGEYHADGFRFDLMGIYDLETIQTIRAELDKTNPGIFLYGEGWAAGHSPMPENQRAVKANMAKLPGVATFSDDMRDALKGSWGNKSSKGFVSGLKLREEAVKFGIAAATFHPQIVYGYVESSRKPWAEEPSQCINYVSCHDNYTLWDKLSLSCPEASDEEKRRMAKLAGAIILTSQGVPFLHSGDEFCRTKGGNGNSYKSPDSVNQIDWSRKAVYYDVFVFFRKLIQLRKNHPAFRIHSAESIRRDLNFCFSYQPGVVAYSLNGKPSGDLWEKIIVVFNGNKKPITLNLPEGKYLTVASGFIIDENGIGGPVSGQITVEQVSMKMLVKT